MSVFKTPESQVLAGCLRYLEIRGIYHWRNSTGAARIGPGRFIRFGKVGSSDILGVLPGGKILCVECKAQGGRLSPEQKQFIQDVRDLGGVCLVVKSWQEIDSALRQEGFISDGPLFEEPRSEAETAENAKKDTARTRKTSGLYSLSVLEGIYKGSGAGK